MPRKKASVPAPIVPPGLPAPEAGKVWLKVSAVKPLVTPAPVEEPVAE